jgi:hypothetical protein
MGLAAEVARPCHAGVPRENLSRSRGPQRLKGRPSSAPHVSGKDTRGCSDAAFMHASLKLGSHRDAR